MLASTLLLAALGAQTVFAAPNLAAKWGLYARQDGSNQNGTDGTSINGTATPGSPNGSPAPLVGPDNSTTPTNGTIPNNGTAPTNTTSGLNATGECGSCARG